MAIVINGSGTVTGLAVGGLPDGTVDAGTLATDSVVTGKIADGTIANADINDLAASKLTGALPAISGASLTNLPVQKPSITDGGNATAMTINATENICIGETPNAWNSVYKALQLGRTASIAGYTGGDIDRAWVTANGYVNTSDGNWQYINTDTASQHEQRDGTHNFFVAPSGSSGATISWTNAMKIANTGEIRAGDLQNSLNGARGISCSGNGYASLRVRRGADNGACMAFYGSSSTSSAVGSISVTTSSTAYNTSSDYRLKENVVDMENATDRVKQLKPKRFNFIADDSVTVDGFLAHEAATVVPECVSGAKDAMRDEEYEVTPAVMDGDTVVTEAVMGTRSVPDMQGIDQSKLVPLLVKTIQELEARITALEA